MKELILLCFTLLLSNFTFGQTEESERLPSFPSGEMARIKFIEDNIQYPLAACRNKIEGKVDVEFWVDTTGKLRGISVCKRLGYGYDEEACRIFKIMPDWIPAKSNGQLVNKEMRITINFILTDDLIKKSKTAHENYLNAREQYTKSNYEETIELLDYSVEEFPDFNEALILRGQAYYNLNDSINACNDWKSAFYGGYTQIYGPLLLNCNINVEDIKLYDDQIFTVPEEMPEFPGGKEVLQNYLIENIEYPVDAYLNQKEGRVFLTFIVEKTGNITDVRVLRGIGHGCDEEAIRTIQNMPNWNPGKLRGIPVRVQYNLPILFVIGEEAKQQMNEAKDIYSEALSHFESANYSEAISLLNKAIELNPWYIDALILRGDVFKELNDLENACVDWNIVKEFGSIELDGKIEEFCGDYNNTFVKIV